MGSIPGLGRSPGGGHGNPFRYSCLENPMDREAWWATIYRVPESRTWLSDLAHKHPGFPAPFAKKLFFSNWVVLATSTKIIWPHMQIVCFLTFHFIPLVSLYISISISIYIGLFLCKYHTVYDQLVFDKDAKTVQWRNNSTFIKWYWDNWVSTYKRMRLDSYSHHIQNSTQIDQRLKFNN